jgi:uncharacterized protein YpmS
LSFFFGFFFVLFFSFFLFFLFFFFYFQVKKIRVFVVDEEEEEDAETDKNNNENETTATETSDVLINLVDTTNETKTEPSKKEIIKKKPLGRTRGTEKGKYSSERSTNGAL